MEQLNSVIRTQLQRDLIRDEALPFMQEFCRTTNLERSILDQFGRPGAEFIVSLNNLVPAFDATCPWQIEGLDALDVVGKVLAPLRRLLPNFVSTLQERVRWVIPARSGDEWKLVYLVDRALYDGRPYYELIVGGAPNATPRLSDRAKSLGWTVPQSMQELCLVHDGFGAHDGGILASRLIVDLGEVMDPIAKEQGFVPDDYEFQDLLEFCPDGAGNCQAFHRQSRDDADPLTVDWDHETREISGGMPFFEFADERLLAQILDEE
ncbi:SMI1/KNR4 family protein [Pseudoduganella violaceinigra]|uniref:SMI1/KNR4 family protein n=1 Tax=Pseudoduganella violaceinigra TaxID=246602 RepID=UPI0004855DC0|nr:SMI1/KNR4 family protein [Pseudoduganella violaceinigra]